MTTKTEDGMSMGQEMKHTPLPWKLERGDTFTSKRVTGNGWIGLATVYTHIDGKPDKEGKANAEFIIKACNSHYALTEQNRELKEALKRMADEWEHYWDELEERMPSDSGCIECTAGTVPNHLNTGLCAYHKARALSKLDK